MGKNQKFNCKDEVKKTNSSKGKKKWNKGPKVRNNTDPKEQDTYSTNDIKWYSNYPELMKDAASINWNTIMGVPIPKGRVDYTTMDDTNVLGQYVSPAGAAMIKVSPSFGRATSESDPLNVAATQGYANIRVHNSGATNYNATDWMLHNLGVCDCYAILNYMIRLYSLYRVYNIQNKYWPLGLVRAMGFDINQLNKEGAQFRFAINALIPKVSAIAVPAVFDIFRRRAYMFQNVYTEGDVVKDQLYFFEPNDFYCFELDSQGAGMLKSYKFDTKVPRDPGTGYRNIWDLYKWAEEMVSHFFGDESTGTITGDILKAFGDNIIKLAPIPEDLFIAPVKDYVVLEQIHNASIFTKIYNQDVTQVVLGGNNGYLYFRPCLDIDTDPDVNSEVAAYHHKRMLRNQKHLLTVNAPDPGPDLNMEITRLHGFVEFDSNNNDWAIYAGSEIVRGIEMIQMVPNGLNGITFMPVITIDNDPASSLTRAENLVVARQFHYLPAALVLLLVPGNTPSDPPIIIYEGESIELTNWTVTNGDVIERLHYTALSSMMYVQPAAFYSNRK